MMEYIREAIKIAKATKPQFDAMTHDDLKAAIGAISNDLKNSGIGAMERLVLNEDRRAMRAELDRRSALQGDRRP